MTPEQIALTEQLVTLVGDWNYHDLISDEQKKECRDIGRKLNAIGGMVAMRDAYYAAKATNRRASTLDAYWDGIGEWRW